MPYPIRSEPVELLRVLFYLKLISFKKTGCLAPTNLLPTAGMMLKSLISLSFIHEKEMPLMPGESRLN